MQIPRINCIYFEDFGKCDKRKKFLGIFRRSCILVDIYKPKCNCELQKGYIKPKYKPSFIKY